MGGQGASFERESPLLGEGSRVSPVPSNSSMQAWRSVSAKGCLIWEVARRYLATTMGNSTMGKRLSRGRAEVNVEEERSNRTE